jgi:hypothetical protein
MDFLDFNGNEVPIDYNLPRMSSLGMKIFPTL